MGEREEEIEEILMDAKALEKAGAFAMVLEFMLSDVAKLVTEEVKIPTIGIGSGPHCDGQVLVWHDLLGIYENVPPSVKKYADLRSMIGLALEEYKNDVKDGRFPEPRHYWEFLDKDDFEKKRKRVLERISEDH